MKERNSEIKVAKLEIEKNISDEELCARLHLATLLLHAEHPEHLSGAISRALELDIDPSDPESAHEQIIRVQEIIEQIISDNKDKLPPGVVRQIEHPPQEEKT